MLRIELELPVGNQTRYLLDGRQSTWPLPNLIGDEGRLRQVLINLIKNALKFTQQFGRVTILPYYDSYTEMLTVDVRDSGVGIAKEDFPRLFTRFGKLHRTAAMNSEGIGLGLTIVKHIVQKSGGRVKVFSKGVKKGACFTFSMKMCQSHQIQTSSQESSILLI